MGFSIRGSADIDAIAPSNYTTKVVVGYPDDIMHWSGYSMAELGELLSTGSAKIPARPHLFEGLEENRPWVQEAIDRYFRQKARIRDPSEVGQSMVEAIRAYVYSGALTPNSPVTIKLKGSDQPLVNTYSLIGHLMYKIIKMRRSWRG